MDEEEESETKDNGDDEDLAKEEADNFFEEAKALEKEENKLGGELNGADKM